MPEVCVVTDVSKLPISWLEFSENPETYLSSVGDYFWFLDESSPEKTMEAMRTRSPRADVTQYFSDTILREFVSESTPSFRASLGFLGPIAVHSDRVQQVFDAKHQPTVMDFLWDLTEITCDWKLEEVPELEQPLRSSIPASSTALDRGFVDRLNSIPTEKIFPQPVNSLREAEVRAGLLLVHNFLEPSHEHSQSIQGQGPDVNGDYWHGIMHRREPDFGNAKYWFRRVGDHPGFSRLASDAQSMVERYADDELTSVVRAMSVPHWNSFAMVDFIEEAHRPHRRGTPWHEFAESLQMREMLILLSHCYHTP